MLFTVLYIHSYLITVLASANSLRKATAETWFLSFVFSSGLYLKTSSVQVSPATIVRVAWHISNKAAWVDHYHKDKGVRKAEAG